MEQRLFWRMEALCSGWYFTRPRLFDAVWRGLWAWAGKRGLKVFDPDILTAAISRQVKPLEFRW
jgi:hypothetical protein